MRHALTLAIGLVCSTVVWADGNAQMLWDAAGVHARIVVPSLTPPTDKLVENTINGHLSEWCGKKLPVVDKATEPGLYIVVGDEKNNPVLAELVGRGLSLDRAGLGDEGYRILTHEAGGRKYVIITANTPAGLKFGCQELVFFHVALTDKSATVDWPLDITKKPAFGYRGIYMLPCWSHMDAIENWRAVLRFNSELTLNRIWFWLGGFPLMDKYGGEYKGSDLANVDNVCGLVKLCKAEVMKFYMGDGWFTWHHAKATGGSLDRSIQYYLDYMDLLPGADGIYLEPVGEGSGKEEKIWRPQAEGLKALASAVWKKRPDYEFAIAIGKFNPPEYRKIVHEVDDKRMFWWWCWGDPLQQKALAEHSLVLRWHVIERMSNFHGSFSAPKPEELPLTGFATSYDPGMGYGNPWNGWGKIGYDKPRNFHPYTMPYFSHQYLFRERCWDVKLSDEAFWKRMARRLFDADMPAESIQRYRALEGMCFAAKTADPQELTAIDKFVTANAGKGSARNRDTLNRMREAVAGIEGYNKNPTTRRRK